jgi:hypothetical protein
MTAVILPLIYSETASNTDGFIQKAVAMRARACTVVLQRWCAQNGFSNRGRRALWRDGPIAMFFDEERSTLFLHGRNKLLAHSFR